MQLILNNISKSFNNKEVVNDFSLKIKKGEIVSLLGPSGCGKTTILKIIGGFLNPDKGSIILDNQDITNTPAEIREVSTVFQSFALFPHMKVINNIIYGLKFKGFSKKEALKLGREYIKLIGLEGQENMYPSTLSGGQKQRVALARSLILNPKVLLLDEALSSLDSKLRIKMRQEIKDIGKKFNVTMIFVTHDKEEAFYMSDRVAVMNKGSIEVVEKPQKIYNNVENNFVRDFVGDCNQIRLNNEVISIRPEDIEISSEKISKSYMKGIIRSAIFMGFYIEYKIEVTASEALIKVKSFDKSKIYNLYEKVFIKI